MKKRKELIIIINISCMSKNRTVQMSKDRSQTNEEHRKIEDFDDKIRILQDNLVFVNALPSDSSSKETLMSPEYFPRYGTVTKLIINPPQSNKRGATYQAYITYSNHLQASLAIVALDGYKLSDRPLKVSFGTTKYCSHFLRGNECPNPDCFYLHKIDKKRQVSSGDTRTMFKEQNAKAIAQVVEHLEQVCIQALQSTLQEVDQGFPSITQTLDYLVDSDEILQSELQRAFERAKVKQADQVDSLQVPKFDTRVQSLADPHQRERQKQSHKLVKSSSHSTMCTPTKNEQIVLPVKRKQERAQAKAEVRQKQASKQNINKQKAVASRQLNVEQRIEKLIIKQIWKKSNSQCKSRFVKGITTSREECSKLKGIVQKFLIAQN